MARWWRARQFGVFVPLLVGTILAMAAAGCNDGPPASPAPPAQVGSASAALPAQGVSAASATPEMFRNLGKRAESAF